MSKKEKKLTPLKEYELKQIHRFPNEKEVKLSHEINNAVNAFMVLSPNIPKAHLAEIQEMHENLFKLDYCVYMAGNKQKDKLKEKLEYLTEAITHLLYCYRLLMYFVKTRCLSVGAANTVIDSLYESKDQIEKWIGYLEKKIDEGGKAAVE